jgi:hypothetical protein
MTLDYTTQKWRSVPSPQGFTVARARPPEHDPETGDTADPGEYEWWGGAAATRSPSSSAQANGWRRGFGREDKARHNNRLKGVLRQADDRRPGTCILPTCILRRVL